jgi:hypothetical protein
VTARGHAPGRARAVRIAGAALLLGTLGSPAPAEALQLRQAGAGATVTRVPTAATHAHALEARLAADPDDAATALDLARALFLAGVDDRRAVARGAEILSLLQRSGSELSVARVPLLLAYGGAFLLLDAKHGTWPPARLRSVRAGLERLDAAVAAAPDDVEVRYLRLVSTLYLPGVFGRRESARSDAAALRRLLPAAPATLPPLLHRVMAEVAEAAP